ncbi:MAG: hypothetical protein LIO77_00475 [Rikenellaceae bacterium]|nr:hypothetical protein [Rikenellaceae bacterium]
MKNIKYFLLFATIAVAAFGCKEFVPGDSFSDKDAFIGFPNSTSGTVNESDGKATIAVALSSVSNTITGTATIVIDKDASTAVAGVNYVDPGTITVEFTGGGDPMNNYKTFDIQLVQNGVFTGTTMLVFKIESVTGGVDIGPWSTYTLTISDAEHPLDAISEHIQQNQP